MEEALECFETQPANMDALRNGGERLKASADRYVGFMEAARPYVELEPLP
jgi:poly-gamma-glutamate capsule biosynthesis protein CapA/YwtB (metallophosphatase superfamily)